MAQTKYAERSFHNNRIHSRCILRTWRHNDKYFGRFLRWCRLVNAIIKKILFAMIIRTHDKKKLISENGPVILAVLIIEK